MVFHFQKNIVNFLNQFYKNTTEIVLKHTKNYLHIIVCISKSISKGMLFNKAL